MDTAKLISDAKARFNHNAAKAYLKEKYKSALTVADQGGLWCSDITTINFLNSYTSPKVVLIDKFENPVLVDRESLLLKLRETYDKTMQEWHTEWCELEKKR